MGDLVFQWVTPRPIAGGAPPPDPGPPTPPPNPPPIPTLVGTPSGALPGSFWVEGSDWHFITSGGQEYRGTGSAVATPPGAVVGSYWVEGETFRYIDASGIERQLPSVSVGVKAAPAIQGSYWVNSPSPAQRQWHWIGGANRYQFWNGF